MEHERRKQPDVRLAQDIMRRYKRTEDPLMISMMISKISVMITVGALMVSDFHVNGIPIVLFLFLETAALTVSSEIGVLWVRELMMGKCLTVMILTSLAWCAGLHAVSLLLSPLVTTILSWYVDGHVTSEMVTYALHQDIEDTKHLDDKC